MTDTRTASPWRGTKIHTAHPQDMVHVPAKFRENTAMRFRVTVRKLNVTDGRTDRKMGGGEFVGIFDVLSAVFIVVLCYIVLCCLEGSRASSLVIRALTVAPLEPGW